jgi:prephenate dehydrogenase
MLVIGLGLIGGSLARSVKESGYCNHVVGYGYRDISLIKGVDQGVIDSYSLDLDEALDGVDLVVVGTPTLVANQVFAELLPRLSGDTIVTDVASVKGSLVETARQLCGGRAPANFVPGHPIAGSERSGVEASRSDLFVDHRVILTPLEETSPDALLTVRRLWQGTGAEVVDMSVDDHDAILAATSHLPHVLAYALVDALAHSELSEDIFRFAAGGFRDFTRIASSDPVMWRDISLANRGELLKSIDMFSNYLGQLRDAVAAGDGEALHKTFTAAKAARDNFVSGSNK